MAAKKKNVVETPTPARRSADAKKKNAKTPSTRAIKAGPLPPMKTVSGSVMAPPSMTARIELHARDLVALAARFEADAMLDGVAHGPSADPWFRMTAAVLHALVLGRRYGLPSDMKKLETLAMRAIRRVRESKKHEPRFALDTPRTVAEDELLQYTIGLLNGTRDARALVEGFIAGLDVFLDVAASILRELPPNFTSAPRVDAAVLRVEDLLRDADLTGEKDGPLAKRIVKGIFEAFGYPRYESLFDAQRKAERK